MMFYLQNVPLYLVITFFCFSPFNQETFHEDTTISLNKQQNNTCSIRCHTEKFPGEYIDSLYTTESLDSIIIETCYYKNYVTISEGYPDYKGRYMWNHKLYIVDENGRLDPLLNSDFFQEKSKQIEENVNNDFLKEYDMHKAIKEIEWCVSTIDFDYYPLDSIEIKFVTPDRINFWKVHEIPSACMNVNSSFASYTLQEFDIE